MSDARVFINSEKHLRISIVNDNITILGNDELVTDDEIFSMYNGNLPAGWMSELDYLKTL